MSPRKILNSKVKENKIHEVDKENPSTWLKFTKNSCKTCIATCCTMPIEVRWEDLVRLKLITDEDLALPLKKVIARLKKEKIITAYREESSLFAMKQTNDGKCRYLIGNQCKVYKDRPLVCRAFPIETGWRHGYCPKREN